MHGITGHFVETWQSSGKLREFWPDWLYDDLPEGIAVWSLGYPARGTDWMPGNSLALPDRAASLLPRLLAEPELQQGNIVFVGHSLGGLVIEQILRNAEGVARHDRNAADFLNRVRGVAFIGTPHSGSDIASLFIQVGFLRASAALLGLGRNDPHLRDLNRWFRGFSHGRLRSVVLQETKKYWGVFVVKLDSSDPGLEPASAVIPIDEDHLSIVKPKDRNADTYVHLRKFLSGDFTAPEAVIVAKSELADVKAGVEASRAMADRILEAVRSPPPARLVGPVGVVDEAARTSIVRLRQRRFFGRCNSKDDILLLAADLLTGEFSLASPQTRCAGLSWCSRMLVGMVLSADPEESSEKDELIGEARRLHREAALLGSGEELVIAAAFLKKIETGVTDALSVLAPLTSAAAQTARFLIATRGNDAAVALEWMEAAGIGFTDVDADGKLLVIGRKLENSEWDAAVEAVGKLTNDDFTHTPMLLMQAAACHLLQAVTEAFRGHIAEHPPFDWADFPLATVGTALEHRRAARELYLKAEGSARNLGCLPAAEHARERALWLDLRDPDRHQEGRKALLELLGSDQSLRYVPMALQFDIPLDRNAVDREIVRQEALGSEDAYEVVLARFSLTMASGGPGEVASFIQQHRQRLDRYFSSDFMTGMEVEALARSDRLAEAESRLEAFAKSGADAEMVRKLSAVLAEARGVDTISDREARYEQSKAIEDLAPLVELLDRKSDWQRLAVRSLELFERTQGLQEALRHVKALSRLQADAELLSFLGRYPELRNQSDDIAGAQAWALFRSGDLKEAQTSLTRLHSRRNHPNDRILQFNILITGGQWEALAPLLDTEWAERDERTAADLLRAGQLAGRFALPRSKEFIRAAAEKGRDDPGILIGCYAAAVRGSWENDPETAGWLMAAASLSGEDGPVRTMSLEEIVSRKPDWDDQESSVTRQFVSGELPMFAVTQLLRRPLIALTLYTAMMNLDERDPRQRGMIFAYSGARTRRPVSPRSIAIEATALYTLGFLGLTGKVLNSFDRVYIPHSTLTWMAQDGQDGPFHQPSQIADAKRLRQQLSEGKLLRLEKTTQVDPALSKEVGDDLATLLAHAGMTEPEGQLQKLVVRSYPVHRIGSLLKEPADLSAHAEHICACGDLVDFLKNNGRLTITEAEKASAYLDVHEKRWPHQVTIEPRATLYLDPLAETYLSLLQLILPLRDAGFTLILPGSVIQEADVLISHDSYSGAVMDTHEEIHKVLAAGISDGRIVLGPVIDEREDDPSSAGSHPTASILSIPTDVDAYVIDDRYINHHMHVSNRGTSRPLMTTLDLLDLLAETKTISAAEKLDLRTKLRRGGYALIPVEADELEKTLEGTTARDGVLVETAELKAIRESVLRIKMSQALQLPKEHPWIEGLRKNSLQLLEAQWQDGVPDDVARARSDWLLDLGNLNGWDHRLPGLDSDEKRAQRDLAQAWAILGMRIRDSDALQRFLAWADGRVFLPVQETDPAGFQRIMERIKALIIDISSAQPPAELQE
ncbi:alpha/beta fold hydrolase [Mesorhizobium sp.]|uniref:alpha/beta fold hydrolase n=1 Tax=Mesorhizobium sp. TaxID=1871066 RepID=UPI0025DD1631|nr:alpha/beta fold hydrolase [Mesorhizobium sp.]